MLYVREANEARSADNRLDKAETRESLYYNYDRRDETQESVQCPPHHLALRHEKITNAPSLSLCLIDIVNPQIFEAPSGSKSNESARGDRCVARAIDSQKLTCKPSLTADGSGFIARRLAGIVCRRDNPCPVHVARAAHCRAPRASLVASPFSLRERRCKQVEPGGTRQAAQRGPLGVLVVAWFLLTREARGAQQIGRC